jgi:sterol desaturase/sphingolipid hydroxylase (fatty acid hydroxylase superfamily)
MSYILYAVPFFFLLISIELVAEKLKKTDYYRLNDAINSLSAGVLSRMIGILKALVPLTVYVLIYQHFAVFSLPDTLWVWVVAFILYDFCYYWNHRMGHEMSLLWAAHVVHHSSEEYNLTTALRQSSTSVFSWIFYVSMAILGFDPLVLISVGSLNLIYQFWIHTRHIPKLGWFEWVFVSPSNHRVHHAQNRVYIDRNYGGVFIIWDRLFGSFQEELHEQPVVFGISGALHSWNPLYANVQVYNQLLKDSWHTLRIRDKLRVWLGRTGWRPADMERDYPLNKADLSTFEKFDIPLTVPMKTYSLVQHAATTTIGLILMLNVQTLLITQQLVLVVVVLYASVSIGLFMERRQCALGLEWAKQFTFVLAAFTLPLPIELSSGLVLSATGSAALLFFIRQNYVLPKGSNAERQELIV